MKKSIEFTPDQFKTLLELVFLGEQVVNAHKVDRIEHYDNFTKHLFSLAKQFNLDNVSLEERFSIYCTLDDEVNKFFSTNGLDQFPLPKNA